MFSVNNDSQPLQVNVIKKLAKPKTNHKIYPLCNDSLFVNALHIDSILENEKQKNKIDSWNKLDKTIKMEKLQIFAEKYGKEHGYQLKEIKSLVLFFIDCLEKKKLQKKKI